MKLLLVAPTVDADDVGEAWVAYQWASRLARVHEVTLLTYNKRGARPAAEQLPDARVVQWLEPALVGRAERLNSMMKPAYFPFYVNAKRWVAAAQRRGERFDVAHQVVPVAMRYPCPVAGSGIPYLIGPVGGSLTSPPGFLSEEGTTPWFQRLRALDSLRLRRDPWLRRSYEQAACVLGIAPYVGELLAGLDLRRFEVLGETGITALPEPVLRENRTGPVNILYVGRLVRTKGARDAIRAISLVKYPSVVFDIVGDGPDRAECEALVHELGLGERVHFHGRLPRARVDEFYRQADIFLFPSYREPGGNVQFEAMAHALPLIVSDRGGIAAAVDEQCAIMVQPYDPEQYAHGLAAAVERLASDSGLRLKMGRAAIDRVQSVGLWDSKIKSVGRLYTEVLAT